MGTFGSASLTNFRTSAFRKRRYEGRLTNVCRVSRVTSANYAAESRILSILSREASTWTKTQRLGCSLLQLPTDVKELRNRHFFQAFKR